MSRSSPFRTAEYNIWYRFDFANGPESDTNLIPAHARINEIEIHPISYPEPSNFLRRMLDENEGSGKDRFSGYEIAIHPFSAGQEMVWCELH